MGLFSRPIFLFGAAIVEGDKIRTRQFLARDVEEEPAAMLAFNVPVFETLLEDPKATALYLYPLKALANDQLKSLRQMDAALGTKANPAAYDGDTPQSARATIGDKSRIIVSNPYAIHRYLAWNDRWRRFFSGLRYIIIDEAHTHRGVFGSNVAMLLKRLLRVVRRYGASPQFILSSATISNPREHSKNLAGRDFSVVDIDGSGRGRKDSLVTLVAFDDPIDQYYMKHPQQFFGGRNEEAIVDLRNPYIPMGHVMCASTEMPPTINEHAYFGDVSEIVESMAETGLLRKTLRGYVYGGTKTPSEFVNLQSISSRSVNVLCGGRVIETLDIARARGEAHEGAVLLHMGETYLVEELDLDLGIAKAKRQDVDYYTEALKLSDVRIKSERAQKTINGITVHPGEVKVTEEFYEYAIRRYEKLVGYFPMDLPPQTFESVAFWFTLSPEYQEQMLREGGDFNGGIHAVEHGMIAMAPLYSLCDRWDLSGLSTPPHPDAGVPTVFVYDGYEGGIGIAEKCYELFPELTQTTLELIRDCECELGCPACIYSPKCGNKNSPLDRVAATKILEYMRTEK
jgi:ATP-dependent helicase YprA (DUF1998 family)